MVRLSDEAASGTRTVTWPGQNGQRQSAYRILVASTKENLDNDIGDIWDTGMLESRQSVNIPFNGFKLESGNRYYWKVKVWDKDKKPSKYSQASWFEIGKLNEEDWAASWISAEQDGSPLDEVNVYTSAQFKISCNILSCSISPNNFTLSVICLVSIA